MALTFTRVNEFFSLVVLAVRVLIFCKMICEIFFFNFKLGTESEKVKPFCFSIMQLVPTR